MEDHRKWEFGTFSFRIKDMQIQVWFTCPRISEANYGQ